MMQIRFALILKWREVSCSKQQKSKKFLSALTENPQVIFRFILHFKAPFLNDRQPLIRCEMYDKNVKII